MPQSFSAWVSYISTVLPPALSFTSFCHHSIVIDLSYYNIVCISSSILYKYSKPEIWLTSGQKTIYNRRTVSYATLADKIASRRPTGSTTPVGEVLQPTRPP
jgi:hypothetical protein